jgi:AcrR family transcriptional regulator
MGRWEPDARGRLERAAMELYRERGFEETMVTEIAVRAGVTQRTFFRHFADKREVLFAGWDQLHQLIVGRVAEAPASMAPLDAVAAALQAAAVLIQEGGERGRERQAVIAAHPDLRERQLIKLSGLGARIAAALRERGLPELAASLTAEAGIAIFKIAFERWVGPDRDQPLPDLILQALAELKAVTAGAP